MIDSEKNTAVHSYGDDVSDTGDISIEIDPRHYDDDGNADSFEPGDVVYFNIYLGDDVSLLNVKATDKGVVTIYGESSISQTEQLTIPGSDTVSLAHPAIGTVTAVEWAGRTGILMTNEDKEGVKCTAWPCLVDVSYKSKAILCSHFLGTGISIDSGDSFDSVIVAEYEVTD